MPWYPVGGQGHFLKWDEPKQLQGYWVGQGTGQYGEIGTIDSPQAGKVQFPLTTVLADRLGRIRIGAMVQIRYLGKAVNKKGTEYKDFEVNVENPDDILPVEPE